MQRRGPSPKHPHSLPAARLLGGAGVAFLLVHLCRKNDVSRQPLNFVIDGMPSSTMSMKSLRAPAPQPMSTTVPARAPEMASAASATSPAFHTAMGAALVAAMLSWRQSEKKRSALSPVALRARVAEPTTPVGDRGKRRQRAGRIPFWKGRQVAIRVNRTTNKSIK